MDPAALLVASEGHLADDDAKLAREAAEQAVALATELKDSTGVAAAHRALVLAQVASSEVAAGLAKVKQELESYKGTDRCGEGVLLLAIAEAQVMCQEPEEALVQAQAAKAAFSAVKVDTKKWEAKVCLAIANAQLMLEQSGAARTSVNEAVKLCREGGDKMGEAAALQQLAVVEQILGEMARAEKNLQDAAALCRDLSSKREEGIVLASLARVFFSEGKSSEALKAAREALEASKEAGHAAGVADAMGLVARASAACGLLEEVVHSMRDEAAACKKAGDTKGEAAALTALFEAWLGAQDIEQALQAARRALGALSTARDAKGSAKVLHSIAVLEYERSHWDLAIRAAHEALAVLAESGGSLQSASELEALVAHSHSMRGEEPPSSALRSKALKVLGDLATALEDLNVEAFEGALKRLARQSGVTERDTARALAPASRKNPGPTEEFLAKHMPDFHFAPPPEPPQVEAREPEMVLRSFPTKQGVEMGLTEEGVDWSQTLGGLTMWCPLSGGPHENIAGGWRQEDVKLEMSKKTLKVTVGDIAFKPLSGELTESVWRKHSWWVLEEESGTLEIHLVKRDLINWKSPWWTYNNVVGRASAKFRRTPFPWNDAWKAHSTQPQTGVMAEFGGKIMMEEIHEEVDIESKAPGRPVDDAEPSYQRTNFSEVFQPKAEKHVCSAEDVVLGVTETENESSVIIQVHFEKSRWDDIRRIMPLERLLAADVWTQEICIFFQGDKQNPILWGELRGHCIPQASSWRLTTSEELRKRQQVPSGSSPALEVRLVKADAGLMWEKAFSTCVQHRLMKVDAGDGSDEPKRFEGLKDARTLRRSGFDIHDQDFWSYVDDYVTETMKRTGHSALPKLVVAK